MQYKKWQHPIRYSGVSKITFKRLIHYIVLITICFIPIHLLSKNINIDFKFIIDHIVIAIFSFFVIFIALEWLEFKLIWSRIALIYSIHEREIPPLTAAILLEIFYKILVIL